MENSQFVHVNFLHFNFFVFFFVLSSAYIGNGISLKTKDNATERHEKGNKWNERKRNAKMRYWKRKTDNNTVISHRSDIFLFYIRISICCRCRHLRRIHRVSCCVLCLYFAIFTNSFSFCVLFIWCCCLNIFALLSYWNWFGVVCVLFFARRVNRQLMIKMNSRCAYHSYRNETNNIKKAKRREKNKYQRKRMKQVKYTKIETSATTRWRRRRQTK